MQITVYQPITEVKILGYGYMPKMRVFERKKNEKATPQIIAFSEFRKNERQKEATPKGREITDRFFVLIQINSLTPHEKLQKWTSITNIPTKQI